MMMQEFIEAVDQRKEDETEESARLDAAQIIDGCRGKYKSYR
jgi:hypothetical protein